MKEFQKNQETVLTQNSFKIKLELTFIQHIEN